MYLLFIRLSAPEGKAGAKNQHFGVCEKARMWYDKNVGNTQSAGM
jgi:hypothetical protein